jgi:ubiquinone/menaquinone biosynthesis C-methylase UbiE
MKDCLKFWDEYEDKSKYDIWFTDPNVIWKKYVRKYIEDKKYKSVLDYGAGLCSEYYGFKNDGYDIKYKAVEVTKYFVEKGLSGGVDIELCEGTKLRFADNEFEACICLDVINHQIDFRDMISEAYRIVGKEAIIVFFCPFNKTRENIITVKMKSPYVFRNSFSKDRINEFLIDKKIEYRWEEIFRGNYRRDVLYLERHQIDKT